jgi:hypothetical protein
VAAGFLPASTDTDVAIEVEFGDGASAIEYLPHPSFDSTDDEGDAIVDAAVCLRLVAVASDRFELQAWAWRARGSPPSTPSASQAARS